MEISRETLVQYADEPAFSAVIDMLIDAGLLAGGWTADDLLRALERYEARLEIVSLFDLAPANDQFEDIAYRASLLRREERIAGRATKTQSQRKWRQKPRKARGEKTRDKQRHAKQTRTRRLERKKARGELLVQQRNELKAKLKSRIAHLPPPKPRKRPAVAWQWDKSANQASA